MEQPTLWEFDKSYGQVLCGVDEAGRGPLAGPVCAGCVCLKEGADVPFLNDSKKMTEKRREQAFALLTGGDVAWYGIGFGTVEEIEQGNILRATFLAMNRAYEMMAAAMDAPPRLALVDGNRDPGLPVPTQLLTKGDSRSAAIAAASVVAKVTRDREMLKLAEQYPQYQFEQHKGYGTPLHYQLLQAHGISPVHRRSFLKNFDAATGQRTPKPTPRARKGSFGETYTEHWLTREGYLIRERNWRCRWGEVDIIAQKGDILAFVEVRTREEGYLASPEESVTPQKRGKLIQTAQSYLQQAGGAFQPRFDVASVVTRTTGGLISVVRYDYYPGAFDGGGSL